MVRYSPVFFSSSTIKIFITFSFTHWLCGFSILEEPDRIAMSYWENDSFVIYLSPVKQSQLGKVQVDKFTLILRLSVRSGREELCANLNFLPSALFLFSPVVLWLRTISARPCRCRSNSL
ncbi:hypothetical protein DJ535_04765 [Citrobacter murliniae]|uniref:Uncharacterized protein n=1 Tax=Citrobacter murliniae TaxID=67829 RepID=A0ABY2PYC0_9ENTR|nr:hypothetical protein DJ535_04765 [Citrobacter murliniae]